MNWRSLINENIVYGGLWALVGKAIFIISGIVLNGLLARLLSASEYGTYFLLISFVTIGTSIALFGTNYLVVKLVAESVVRGIPERIRSAIPKLFIIVLGGSSIIGFFVFSGIADSVGRSVFGINLSRPISVILSLWVMFQSLQILVAESFRGFDDVRLATLFNGLLSRIIVLFSAVVLILIFSTVSLDLVLFITFLSYSVSVVISIPLLIKKIVNISHQRGSREKVTLKETISWNALITSTLPLGITGVTLLIMSQADLWLLGLFGTKESVAVYGVSIKSLFIVSMPLIILNEIIPPKISKFYTEGRLDLLEKFLQRSLRVVAIPSITLVILIVFSGDIILGVIFGDYFAQGKSILLILSTGYLFNVFAGSCGMVLIHTGHQKEMMQITVFSTVIIYIMGAPLVSMYGPIGAAIISSSAMVLQNILMLIKVKQQIGIRTHLWIQPGIISFFR